ncbi:MAG: hypothetical protein KC547_05915 [Anaerolineae bacterium]|nr:hypothetical protein [Anaerolineae bacterium]
MLRWFFFIASIFIVLTTLPASKLAAQPATPSPPPLQAESPLVLVLMEGETAVFSYRAQGSQSITVSAKSLEAPGVLDPVLEVLDADNRRLAINDDRNLTYGDLAETDAVIPDLLLPEAAVYFIQVRTFTGTGTGRLQLALTAAPPPPSAQSQAGDAITRVLVSVPQYGVAEYAVQVYTGQRLSLGALAHTDGFDTILELLSPEQDIISENDDHAGDEMGLGERDSFIGALDITDTGIYIARVRGYGGAGGDVELIIEREQVEPVIAPPRLRDPIVAEDEVEIGDVFEQPFNATAGDLVTVIVEPLTIELDPRIAVVDLFNRVIETGERIEGNSNLPARIERLLIETTGDYTAQVRSYLDTGGAFKLTILHEARAVPFHEPTVTTANGELTTPGQIYRQTFAAQAGDYVTVEVRSQTVGFDPRLRLIAPSGDVLAANDDHGSSDPTLGLLDARIHLYPITVAGTYTLEIDAFDATPGLFEVTIRSLR